MDSEKRNLMLAMIASICIFGGYYYFYERPQMDVAEPSSQQQPLQSSASTNGDAPAATNIGLIKEPYDIAKTQSQRVEFESNAISGSLSLTGGRIDDLSLTHYKESLKPGSGPVLLLSPKNTSGAYYMESGWVSPDKSITMPDPNTQWRTSASRLKPGESIQLQWQNTQGVLFVRTIALDETYLFTVTDKIKNGSKSPFQVSPYALLSRRTSDETGSTSYALHEGAVGYLDGKLKEEKYKDIGSKKSFNKIYQVTDAQLLSKSLGVDEYELHNPQVNPSSKESLNWLPKENKKYIYKTYRGTKKIEPCHWPWSGIVLNWDGGISACCIVDDPKSDFGDFKKSSLETIWNNDSYISARAEFGDQTKIKKQTICNICKNDTHNPLLKRRGTSFSILK